MVAMPPIEAGSGSPHPLDYGRSWPIPVSSHGRRPRQRHPSRDARACRAKLRWTFHSTRATWRSRRGEAFGLAVACRHFLDPGLLTCPAPEQRTSRTELRRHNGKSVDCAAGGVAGPIGLRAHVLCPAHPLGPEVMLWHDDARKWKLSVVRMRAGPSRSLNSKLMPSMPRHGL